MKKGIKKAALLLSAVIVAGGLHIPASAQELNDTDPGTESVSDTSTDITSTDITISGVTATLDCANTLEAMKQSVSAEDIASSSWFLQADLTYDAASFYYVLEDGTNGDGVQDFNDNALVRANQLAFHYSDGIDEAFSGIKIMDTTGTAPMTAEEWASIQENLCKAYSAFLLDHPDISWLTKSPMITKVSYSWTDETGLVSFQDKIYLQLKNDNYRYHICSAESQDTEEKGSDTPSSEPDKASSPDNDTEDNTDKAASIHPASTGYTALANAVSAVSDDGSAALAADAPSLATQDKAYIYLPSSSGSYNTNWFLSDIFASVEDKVYYGDTWGQYVDLSDVRDHIYLTVDGDSAQHEASDGEFILKNYLDAQVLSQTEPLKAADLNPHCLFWAYNGNEYLVERSDIHMHVQVNPKVITAAPGSLQITQAADGSKNPSGEPDFEGLIPGESLTQSDWTVIPTDNINEADKTIQVRIALTDTNGANIKYSLSNDVFWVPYSANLLVEPENVKIILLDKGPFVYNGQEHRPAFEVIVFDHILDKSSYEASYSSNINAGTATISVISKTDTDYHWDGSVSSPFTINKAVWQPKYGEGYTRYGKTGSFNLYDMELLAPDASVDLNNIIFTDSRVYAADGTPSVSNGILQYEFADSEELINHTSTILIPVDSSKNYEDYTITFIATVSDKTMQDFKFLDEVQKKPVGNTDILKLTDPAEGSTVTFKSSNEDIVSINQNGRINALREGTVTIYATASAVGDYAEATTKCTLIIVPEDHTVTTVELTDRDKQYKLEIEEGISQVSEPLAEHPELDLNTPGKIDNQLRDELKRINSEITDKNIAVYDITLLTRQNNTWVWERVTDEDFPGDGLLIEIPYPEKTAGDTHDFTVVHMFDTSYGNKLGDIERPSTDESEDMLRFTVHALSPVAVGWTEQADDPDDPTDPTDPTDPDDPANPSNPANPNNPGSSSSAAPTAAGSSGGSGGSGGGTGSGGSGGGGVFYRVATGDTSPIIVYGALSAASIALIVIIYLIRKEFKK